MCVFSSNDGRDSSLTCYALDNYNAWVGSASKFYGICRFHFHLCLILGIAASVPSLIPRFSTTLSAPTTAIIAGDTLWNYEGCYQDDTARIMNQGPFTDTAQTVEKCLTYCQKLGRYLYAGVADVQCFCSNSIPTGAIKAAETDCSESCPGNGEVFFFLRSF